jgi:hypothetical protein
MQISWAWMLALEGRPGGLAPLYEPVRVTLDEWR